MCKARPTVTYCGVTLPKLAADLFIVNGWHLKGDSCSTSPAWWRLRTFFHCLLWAGLRPHRFLMERGSSLFFLRSQRKGKDTWLHLTNGKKGYILYHWFSSLLQSSGGKPPGSEFLSHCSVALKEVQKNSWSPVFSQEEGLHLVLCTSLFQSRSLCSTRNTLTLVLALGPPTLWLLPVTATCPAVFPSRSTSYGTFRCSYLEHSSFGLPSLETGPYQDSDFCFSSSHPCG